MRFLLLPRPLPLRPLPLRPLHVSPYGRWGSGAGFELEVLVGSLLRRRPRTGGGVRRARSGSSGASSRSRRPLRGRRHGGRVDGLVLLQLGEESQDENTTRHRNDSWCLQTLAWDKNRRWNLKSIVFNKLGDVTMSRGRQRFPDGSQLLMNVTAVSVSVAVATLTAELTVITTHGHVS